ncbi:MAG: hypothetical protein RBR35_07125 [Salinivirgaceae bacterium]|nr:hypothetical protein [Salinivirgaceae bacterium]MDY0280315.1 hypothetical protein [Salinivirgaceae bacterium]
MEKKLNLIKIPHGKGRRLARIFGCTPARVSQALNGNLPDNELTKKIRYVALTQYDGVELESVTSKNK